VTNKKMVIIITREEVEDGIATSREVIGDDLEYLERKHWLDKIFREIEELKK